MSLRSLMQWSEVAGSCFHEVLFLAKAACAMHLINANVVTVAMTYGASMAPTIGISSELLLADRINHKVGKVGRGDIVLLRSPDKPKMVICKRIIAMEGDSVTYLVDPRMSDRCETIVVPKGHVWVEGDNKYASLDSRKFGSVPYGLIEGRIFWRVSFFSISLSILLWCQLKTSKF